MDLDFEKELDTLQDAGRPERLKVVLDRVLECIDHGRQIIVDSKEFKDHFAGISDETRALSPPFHGLEPFCGAELARRKHVIDKCKVIVRRLYEKGEDSSTSMICHCRNHCTCSCAKSSIEINSVVYPDDLTMLNALCPGKFTVSYFTQEGIGYSLKYFKFSKVHSTPAVKHEQPPVEEEEVPLPKKARNKGRDLSPRRA
jgi:hypothetical protein